MKTTSVSRRWYGCHAIPALALPLLLWQVSREVTPTMTSGAAAAASAEVSRGTDHAGDRLVGVWQRWQADAEGDPVRFYYFHGDGHGLYRYGKVGLTNTHAFDYQIDGDTLALRFRRTGEAHRLSFVVERDPAVAGRSWLTIAGDPREAGARYFRDDDAATATLCAAAGEGEGEVALGRVLGNRLWGEERRFAAGGMGFAIYQLQPQTIDGRGVGWFHRGDYDEWTTEALTYRQQGEHLTIHFMLEGRSETTPIGVREAEGARWLDLAVDPRDYWRAHSYRDMGRSFAGAEALGGAPWGPGCLPAGSLRR